MPVLPRPARLSLHDAVRFVAERCECTLIEAGKAALAAVGEGKLVASANVLVPDRSYMPGVDDGATPVGPPRRVDAGVQQVPTKVWISYPWASFEKRALHPHGNAMFREHRADDSEIGRVYVNPTIATADIDRWLDDDPPQSETGVVREARRGPEPGTLNRYGEADRALFPEIERIKREHLVSVTAAALMLAEGKIEGKAVPGHGSPLSKAKRLATLYRKEADRSKPPKTR